MMNKIKRDKLGRFIKGEKSLREGIKLSKEEIENLKRGKIDMWKNKEHPRGMLGKKMSKETKEKKSNAMGKWHKENKGTKKYLERNKKVSENTKGKKKPSLIGNTHGFKKEHTPWNKGLKGERSHSFGVKFSEERINKMRDALKGKKRGKTWNKGLKTGLKGWKKRKFTEETINKIKKARAKQVFPIKDTSIEIKIQNFLKQLNIEFFTHQYMKEIEHGYQCDILIPIQNGINKKTIIECFGNYWHKFPMGREIDIQRCSELREKGWRVLTFWESEIKPMQLNNLQEKLIC